ncbi:sterigmatocystin biosynthesis regulatory protein [Aspergillus udagawae]|uniref:Sterigmatocystin biosynthesis regulatory protein n=1 Tax=Aspergillus udagawae TaxID=91492 RepID=A0A8H3NEU1_9EURO|nr:sterigmatocystin biosynthesis regulatory protein [Aspergillus udagawae]
MPSPHSPPSPPGTQAEVTASWERLRKSCDSCQEAKVKCSQHKPSCHRCLRHRQPCVYSPQRRTGRPRKKPAFVGIEFPTVNSGGDINGTIIREPTSSTINGQTQDLVMADVRGDEPRLLTGDITADNINPLDGVFQSSFEALLAASPVSKHPTGRDINSDAHHTGYLAASPPSSDAFGDLSLFLPDYNIPILPHPAPALSIDQLPSLTVDASNTSSECGDCGAKCYTMLLQQLLFLRQSLPETTRPSIDVILQVERHVRSLLDRVLGCSPCLSNRSSVLLMSVITERVIQMLDWIIEEKTLLDTESARSSRRTYSSWARTSGLPPTGSRAGDRTHVCHIPLVVGNTELDEDTKQYFLKQLILMRMKKLAVKVQNVRLTTNRRPGDCIYRAAELVLAESLQRLDYLRGQVQLWE